MRIGTTHSGSPYFLCCDLHLLLVLRTFWTIFLVAALTLIPVGAFVFICACPLSNHKLFKVGGALQLYGGKNKLSSSLID